MLITSARTKGSHISYGDGGPEGVMNVCKQLPCGLPEYIYQEAFSRELKAHGIEPNKEYQHHPVYNGEPLESYLKMDFMVERDRGNVVVEAKAIEKLTSKERSQLFGYMVGTGFPVGLLVNFSTYPHPQIERYYFDKKAKRVFTALTECQSGPMRGAITPMATEARRVTLTAF